MSLNTNGVFYHTRSASDLAVPQRFGKPRRKWPLVNASSPSISNLLQKSYAFDQDYTIALDFLDPDDGQSPLNTKSPDDANAILVAESQPEDMGSGIGKWTREYRIVPAAWDEFLTQTVTFPGIRDTAYTGGVRDPKPLLALTRLRRDYFVVDPSNLATGVLDSAGNAIVRVNSKGAIPSLYRTPWKFLLSGAILATSEVTGLVKAGGITGWLETVPNTATYQAWIAVAVAFNAALAGGGTVAWDATHPPVWDGLISPPNTIGQYRFADSRIEDYAGNIFCRVSEYVLAQ